MSGTWSPWGFRAESLSRDFGGTIYVTRWQLVLNSARRPTKLMKYIRRIYGQTNQLQLNNLASHEINCDLVQTIIQSITGSWWQNNPHTSLAPSRCWPTGHGGVDFLLRNSPNIIQTPCHPISKCMEITHLWQSIKCFVK